MSCVLRIKRCKCNLSRLYLFGYLISCYLISKSILGTNEKLETSRKMTKRLLSVDFEVFGLVQGVFFRKYTKKAAEGYGLVGWCKNTRDDTVQGKVQGRADAVAKMKTWLETVGSPHSRIDEAVFKNEQEIEKLDYDSFTVEH